jgi:hypothetical protein
MGLKKSALVYAYIISPSKHTANSKKPKCLPQAQHRHIGYFGTR